MPWDLFHRPQHLFIRDTLLPDALYKFLLSPLASNESVISLHNRNTAKIRIICIFERRNIKYPVISRST
jgi:hypothetical protein